MKEFFSTLENILFECDVESKIFSFRGFYSDFLEGKFYFDFKHHSKINPKPSYSHFCKIIHPIKITRPKDLSSLQNIAKIIHSIAHIEYSAIDLAIDAAYRFKNLPLRYYQDWLEVASEEIKHFELLKEILRDLGFAYGDFAVHNKLFQAMLLTNNSLIERMGLVHRGLEAMGLDANPFVIEKCQSITHPIKTKIIQALEIILKDEISHVQKGDKWWKHANPHKEDFIKLLQKFNTFSLKGKILNTQARLQAGFTQEELTELQNFSSS